MCNDGTLTPVEKSFTEQETSGSINTRHQAEEAWEPDWYLGRFSGRLVCIRQECSEPVVVCGDSIVVHTYEDPEHGEAMVPQFRPVFFHPAPPIFRIPQTCIEPIKSELKRAWALHWSDSASCANRIRTCVEMVLTHLKIPRFTKGKKGRVRLNLHTRIQLFEKRDSTLARSLMAVKWIGNVGSHAGDLDKEQVLDGFELLEHVLIEVFDKRTRRIEKLGKQIVKGKGRRKRN